MDSSSSDTETSYVLDDSSMTKDGGMYAEGDYVLVKFKGVSRLHNNIGVIEC